MNGISRLINPSNFTFQCHTWDSAAKKWVQDHVTTVKEEIDISGVAATVVTCNVTKMVEIALFKGPPRPEPSKLIYFDILFHYNVFCDIL